MKAYIVLFFCLIFIGCASNAYKQPPNNKNIAMIGGTEKKWGGILSCNWEKYNVSMINGQELSFFSTDAPKRLLPGEHEILIYANINKSCDSKCPCSLYSAILFTAEPGKAYLLNGEVKENTVKTWIEEKETGEIVSKIAEASYQPNPETITIPLPVY